MHERPAPRVADDLRTENDVPELTRHAGPELVPSVDREGKHVRRLVDPEVLALECPHLVRPDEREPEVALIDPFGRERRAADLGRGGGVDRRAASVLDLDGDQRRGFASDSSAWLL